ncbi:hypothetical protein BDK51DRAFT_50456, partial [Blyttiomyces helicus]
LRDVPPTRHQRRAVDPERIILGPGHRGRVAPRGRHPSGMESVGVGGLGGGGAGKQIRGHMSWSEGLQMTEYSTPPCSRPCIFAGTLPIQIAGGILDEPKANLMVVVLGLEPDTKVLPATYFLAPSEPASPALVSSFASAFIELSASTGPAPVLAVTSKQGVGWEETNVLRATIKEKAATVSIPIVGAAAFEKSLKDLATAAYVGTKAHLTETFGSRVAVFDEENPIELDFISRLAGAFAADPETSSETHFATIELLKLQAVYEAHGQSSEQYATAVDVTREAVNKLAKARRRYTQRLRKSQLFDSFAAAHSSHASGEIFGIAPQASSSSSASGLLPYALAKRQAPASSAINLACPATATDCNNAFSSCSNHGICTPQKVQSLNNSICYLCSCTGRQWTDDNGAPVAGYSGPVTWGGNACQYQDITVPFHIIFWLGVALFVTLV